MRDLIDSGSELIRNRDIRAETLGRHCPRSAGRLCLWCAGPGSANQHAQGFATDVANWQLQIFSSRYCSRKIRSNSVSGEQSLP
jgi:hypothetical protein